MTRKNAQIEIVGLLIIVLIITFILIFMFTSNSNESEVNLDEIHDVNLATSIIISMINTDTDCTSAKPRVRNLIIDAARANVTGTYFITCTGGENSLVFSKQVFKEILDKTMDEWNKNYEFIVTKAGGDYNTPDDRLIRFTNSDFEQKDDAEVGIVALPLTNQGTISIVLCIGGCGS